MVLVPKKSQSLLPSFKSKMLDHTGFPVPEVSPGLFFPQQQLLLQFFLMMITAQIAQEQAALGTPRKERGSRSVSSLLALRESHHSSVTKDQAVKLS